MFLILYVIALVYLTVYNGILFSLFAAPAVAFIAYVGLSLIAEAFYSTKK